MQLGARLQTVADFVPRGSRVADIGTDHAYLPIMLTEEKKVAGVIACDVNEGPYTVACNMVREAGLVETIEVRLGNGLKVLKPDEVDTVTIAGMGGGLICEILEASADVVGVLTALILQPMNGAAELRGWLYANKWYIEDEALTIDDNRLYEVIYARQGVQERPEELLLEIGPVLWRKKPKLLKQHIENLLFQKRRAVLGMKNSTKAMKTKKYTVTIERILELERRLKW
jgi:tRNA (adenine22-N1)-methyltransferase